MAEDVRARMITSARYVLAREGYQGASFSSVLEHSGAPRGSIYYHFPGGKDELVTAAVDSTLERSTAQLEEYRGRSLETVMRAMSNYWRTILEVGELRAGCAVIAVSVGATDPALREHVGQLLTRWRAHYRSMLEDSGVSRRRSAQVASVLFAGFEGALHLARAERSIAVYDDASRGLRKAAAYLAAG